MIPLPTRRHWHVRVCQKSGNAIGAYAFALEKLSHTKPGIIPFENVIHGVRSR